MNELSVIIKQVDEADLENVRTISEANKSYKDNQYWDLCRMRLESGEISIYLAELGGQFVGYAFLNWHPKYRVYQQLGIPEIQDLNVLSNFRRRGIARKIIRTCEDISRQKGYEDIGISFGLTKDYGHAQRLYISLGYVPDGYGVTYDRMPVSHGQIRPVDDDLCLMLIKKLTA